VAWVKPEGVWLFCPDFADIFVRREAAEGFAALGEIVGGEEIGEMLAQLPMAFIVVASHRWPLERPVHSLDLPSGPRMVRLGRPLFGALALASSPEG